MNELIACLDIGTNTVLLLTAQADPAGRLVERTEACRTTRLGENTGGTGRLTPEAMSRTLDVVAEFAARARREAPHGRGVVAATSAVRDAGNREEFLGLCRECLGSTPVVLSGGEEAEAAFLGAASERRADEFVVTIDIGGGSTEIGAGLPGRSLLAESLDLGCVRFGERFGLYEIAAADVLEKAREAIRGLLAPACARLDQAIVCAETEGGRNCPRNRGEYQLTARGPARRGRSKHGKQDDPGPPASRGPSLGHTQTSRTVPTVVASGGTATAFAALQIGLEDYDRDAVHGYECSHADLESSLRELSAMSSKARSALPGISRGRAPLMPAGLLILAEATSLLRARRFVVTTRGLRFGLALQVLAGTREATWTW